MIKTIFAITTVVIAFGGTVSAQEKPLALPLVRRAITKNCSKPQGPS